MMLVNKIVKKIKQERIRKLEVEKEVSNSNGTLQHCNLCDNVLPIYKFLLFDRPDLHDGRNVLFGGRWLTWTCKSCVSIDEHKLINRLNGLHNGTIKRCARCN